MFSRSNLDSLLSLLCFTHFVRLTRLCSVGTKTCFKLCQRRPKRLHHKKVFGNVSYTLCIKDYNFLFNFHNGLWQKLHQCQTVSFLYSVCIEMLSNQLNLFKETLKKTKFSYFIYSFVVLYFNIELGLLNEINAKKFQATFDGRYFKFNLDCFLFSSSNYLKKKRRFCNWHINEFQLAGMR